MAGSSFRVKPGERVMRPPTPLQCNPALQSYLLSLVPLCGHTEIIRLFWYGYIAKPQSPDNLYMATSRDLRARVGASRILRD